MVTINEIEHHYRVVDQTLTAHSALRDVYRRRAMIVDTILVASSILLCATVFVDSEYLTSLGVSLLATRTTIGICSMVNFFLSILIFWVNWKQQSEKYAQSCIILSALKTECRKLIKSVKKPADDDIECVAAECSSMLSRLPPIPENQFHKLKARHLAKIELSKLIDANPGLPVWILRVKLFFRSLKKLRQKAD